MSKPILTCVNGDWWVLTQTGSGSSDDTLTSSYRATPPRMAISLGAAPLQLTCHHEWDYHLRERRDTWTVGSVDGPRFLTVADAILSTRADHGGWRAALDT